MLGRTFLYVQSGIHYGDGHGGRHATVGCIDGILNWVGKLGQAATSGTRRARKGVGAIESGAGRADLVNCPQSPSEFHKVIALRYRGVILQFVVILVIELGPRGGASSRVRSLHIDAYRRTHWILIAVVAQILEARLIDSLRTEHLCVGDLHGVFGGQVL